jgi:hypothetical protein
MEKKVTSPLVTAIIITLLLAVIDIVAGFAHFRMATWYRWIPLLVFLVAIIWACATHATQQNGNVSFGNVFAHGFKTSAICACLGVIYTLLSLFVIFPDSKDLYIEQARKQMEERGGLSEENINSALEITRKFFLTLAIAGGIVGTLIVGAIASLIGAAVAKKNPQSPFDKQG